MDKTNTNAEEMKAAEALSGDINSHSTSDTVSLFIDDEIKQATIRMEELWNNLASVWPAVKMNREVANKIEKLWSYLKEAENEYLVLPDEIEELINDSLSDTPFQVSAAAYTNITGDNSTANISASNTNTGSSAAEIDDLLAEILGEGYRLGAESEQQEQAKNDSTTSDRTTYITGSRELDELVASILGEGWEKDDTDAATEHFTSVNTRNESVDEWHDEHIKQNLDNTGDDFDLDVLVGAILADSEITSRVEQIESVTQPADGSSIELPDIELSRTELSHNPAIIESHEPEQAPGFESETPSEEIAPNVTPEADHMIETDPTEQTLEELIKQTLQQESSIPIESDLTESITGSISENKDLDELINEVLNTQNEPSPATEHTDTLIQQFNKPESLAVNFTDKTETETTKKTIEARLSPGITETPDVTPIRSKPKTTVASPPQTAQGFERTPEMTYHKQSESRLVLAGLLLLIVCIAAIGSWKYLISNENIRTAKVDTDKKIIKPPVIEERKPESIEPASTVRETASIKPPPAPIIPESQTTNSPAEEENVFTQKSKTTHFASEYRARIEQNENDITIIINEPVEKEPSLFYHEDKYSKDINGNTIDNIPVPVEKTAYKDKPGIKPAINEKTHPKTGSKARRKIIIHTVVKGDTLWAIAKRYIDNPYKYRELAKLSKIKNPDRIYPGNKVRIIKYSK